MRARARAGPPAAEPRAPACPRCFAKTCHGLSDHWHVLASCFLFTGDLVPYVGFGKQILKAIKRGRTPQNQAIPQVLAGEQLCMQESSVKFLSCPRPVCLTCSCSYILISYRSTPHSCALWRSPASNGFCVGPGENTKSGARCCRPCCCTAALNS